LIALGVVTGAAVVWIAIGRRISRLIDHVIPGRRQALPFDPLRIKFDPEGIGSHFTLGNSSWSLSWPHVSGSIPIPVLADSRSRLVLGVGTRWFTLGPIRTMWKDPVQPEYEFVPEPGDEISLIREISRVPWPTPFEFSWLGGASPKWGKFIYNRLRWTKTSNASLEILWVSQMVFYPRSGWFDQNQNFLTRIIIRPGPTEKSAARHLTKTKGWTPADYCLEPSAAPSGEQILIAGHHADANAQGPNGGKSLQLHIMNKRAR